MMAYGKGDGYGYNSSMPISLTPDTSDLVQNAQFLAVQKMNDMNTGMDGILGLLPNVGYVGESYPHYIQQVYEAGLIPELVFGVQLGHEQQDSVITFGGIDSKYQAGPTTWLDVITNQPYWASEISSFSIEGQAYSTYTNGVVFDTGTSLFMMNPSDYQTFYNAIGAKCTLLSTSQPSIPYATKCTCLDGMQPMILNIQGTAFTLDLNQLTIEQDGYCYFGVGAMNTPLNYWIMGDMFLRNYYMIFSEKNM